MKLVHLFGRIHWLRPLPVVGIRVDSRRFAAILNLGLGLIAATTIFAIVKSFS